MIPPSSPNQEALFNQARECTALITYGKARYTTKTSIKLDNPYTVPKTYWSIINRFLNTKKIPILQSILANGKLISDFQKKTYLFNNQFTSQCTPIKNTSRLPNFQYKTGKRLTSIEINNTDILLIIKNLHVDKTDGWDNLSIRTFTFCNKSLILSLKLIFN